MAGISQQYIGHAKVVIDHAPDLVDAVVNGSTPLNEAYKTAQERKAAANTTESKMERLKAIPESGSPMSLPGSFIGCGCSVPIEHGSGAPPADPHQVTLTHSGYPGPMSHGVAEHVRVDLPYPGSDTSSFHHLLNAVSGELTFLRQPQAIGHQGNLMSAPSPLVPADRVSCQIPKRGIPDTPALAQDSHRVCLEVEI